MPQTQLIFFKELSGEVPLLEWLDGLEKQAKAKCFVKLSRLAEIGHELRRPEADFLRDGIYELRIGLRGRNYRILYFFYRNVAAVVSHGLIKEAVVPPAEIEAAISRKMRFESDPMRHSHEEF